MSNKLNKDKLEKAITALRAVDYLVGDPGDDSAAPVALNDVGIVVCEALDDICGPGWKPMTEAEALSGG